MAQSIPSTVTYTRESIATYHNSSGIVIEVQSGDPRFDYDPTTLTYRGLLLEESYQNLCVWSKELSQWVTTNATVDTDVAVSPDGNENADRLVGDATIAAHNFKRTISVGSNEEQLTLSVYGKADTHSAIALRVDGSSSGTLGYGTFDLTTGDSKTGPNVAAEAARITAYPNGWYRCEITVTKAAADTSLTPHFHLVDDYATPTTTYDATGDRVYFWGMQLESAKFASSFIPTDATQTIRERDNFTIDLAQQNIDEQNVFNFTQDRITMWMDFSTKYEYGVDTRYPRMIEWGNPTNNQDRVLIYVNEIAGNMAGSVFSNNVQVGIGDINVSTNDFVEGELVLAVRPNDGYAKLSSGTSASSSTIDPRNPSLDRTIISLGRPTEPNNENNNRPNQFWIRKLKVYNQRLSQTTIDSLFTP